MKKKNSDNLKAMAILIPIIVIIKMIEWLPWWSAVIPVIILGALFTLGKWEVSYFRCGFFSGFLIWFGADVFFYNASPGLILNRVGLMLSIPVIVIMLLTGVIGGLLIGLAFYTGKCFFTNNSISALE